MTQRKERLRDLWKCRNRPSKSRRTPAERAIKHACAGKVRILEIERSALKVELAEIAYKFRDKRNSKVAIAMADLIVKIEDIDRLLHSLHN